MPKTMLLPKKQYLLLLTIFAVQGIFAQTIRYVNASIAGGANDGTTWANAYTNLQTALAAYQNGDQIWVAKGTYYPTTSTTDRTASFVMKNNLGIYGGFAGTETLLSQRNWTTNLTTLSGDIDNPTDPLMATGSGVTLNITGNTGNSYHVVYTTNSTSNSLDKTAVLDGFTISGGNANDAFSDSSGGGILIIFSSPTLTNLVFLNNNAYHYGGGIYNYVSSPILTNIVLSRNYVKQFGGAGMYNRYASPTLTKVTFLGNYAAQAYGGGMYNSNSSPSLTNLTFSGNYGIQGGGLYNESSSPTLNNAVFSENLAFYGGAISNVFGSPILTNIVFSNDSAQYGGGIYNFSSSPSITNALFTGNGVSQYGGGICNFYSSSQSLTNVVFSGNRAYYQSGGIYNTSSSTSTIKNSIFFGNTVNITTGGVDIGDDNSSTTTVSNTSLQFANGMYGLDFTLGTGNLFAQTPIFVNAANPAGIDGIFGTVDDGLALQACSPAINAGSNVAASAISTDLTGAARIQGTAVDMGAYEFTGSNNGNPIGADLLAANNDTSTTILPSGQATIMMVDGSNCKAVATIQPNGASPIAGVTTAKVWIDASVQANANNKPYLQRHYQITPANNATTATATVRLYFLQSEFTAYNAYTTVANGSYPKLPMDVTDAANYRTNLNFTKISGTSSDGSGTLETYSGGNTCQPVWFITAGLVDGKPRLT